MLDFPSISRRWRGGFRNLAIFRCMAIWPELPSASLRRIPPQMQDAVLHRGEWSLCAMEHSLIGPVRIDDPGMPFHHLMLPLGERPLTLGQEMDGRCRRSGAAHDLVGVIEAGSAGVSWWNAPLESACFYFMPEALGVVLGDDVAPAKHVIRSTPGAQTAIVARLLRALWADATNGQPHGRLIGDSIFLVL